jgi:uncharacterized protein (TIGR00251 family)
MTGFFRLHENEIHADIKALPGVSKTEFAGVKDGRLRIRIAAAPEDGRANEELRRFLAKALGCPKREVLLKTGEKSRFKTLVFPASCLANLEKTLDTPRRFS